MNEMEPKIGWKPVTMVGVKKGKLYKYKAFLCINCDCEVITLSNFCPRCGKFHGARVREEKRC